MRDDKAKFDAAGSVVFGINNASADAHRRYAEKYAFPFPLLADPDLQVSRAYGAEKGGGVKRTVVVVDPEGRVRYHRHGMPTDDEILQALGKP